MASSRTLVIKLYYASNRMLGYLVLLLRAGLTGFWLGILSKETLHSIDQKYYDSQGYYCDESYNKSGFFKGWEEQVVEQYFRECKSLLVAAAGGGREVLALRRKGFNVDSFECHPDLRYYANQLLEQEGFPPNVMLVPRDECPNGGQTYDGIIVGWGAYIHIQGSAQRREFLKKLREKTRQGGPILLSFYVRSRDSRVRKLAVGFGNIFRWVLRRERIELGDDLVPFYAHYFSRNEIASELAASGFDLEYYSTKSYGHAVAFAR